MEPRLRSQDRTQSRPICGYAAGHNAYKRVLEAAGIRSTVHGFRSSFREWAEKAKAPRHVAEQCLAHNVRGSVERAYFRDDLMDQRRGLMAEWAAHCTARRGGVVALRA